LAEVLSRLRIEGEQEREAGFVVDTGDRSGIGMSIPEIVDPKDAES
jgi:hypothetical protein